MEILKDALSYLPVGVIIGYFAKYVTDNYLNRPKINFNIRSLKLYRIRQYESGDNVSVILKDATKIELVTDLVITNTGNTKSAIVDIDIRLYSKSLDFSTPFNFKLTTNNKEVPNAFNIDPNSCEVFKVVGSIHREEQEMYENFFVDEGDLELYLEFLDVKGKEHVVKIDEELGGTWVAIE